MAGFLGVQFLTGGVRKICWLSGFRGIVGLKFEFIADKKLNSGFEILWSTWNGLWADACFTDSEAEGFGICSLLSKGCFLVWWCPAIVFWNRKIDFLLLSKEGDSCWPGRVWNISLDVSCLFARNPWLCVKLLRWCNLLWFGLYLNEETGCEFCLWGIRNLWASENLNKRIVKKVSTL